MSEGLKLKIIGNGAFGSFLSDILAEHLCLTDDISEASSFVLAVPISSYETVAIDINKKHSNPHLINVCSVQSLSTKIINKYSNQITSIHPLFGKRTPIDFRNSILTFKCNSSNECEFLSAFSKISKIITEINNDTIDCEIHDKIMAKTHVAAVMAAKQMKIFVDRASDIPDELLPNSFRLLKQFVKTLDDMPQGTMESIMANPFF